MNKKVIWPDNKKFAFTIVDDTDFSTLENIKPIYDYLHELNLKTTKTVWVLNQEDNVYKSSDTLQRNDYFDYILKLQNLGFEIALHGARGCSSNREQILKALDIYKNKLGEYPKIHINHAQNKDNLYWGFNRLFNIQKWIHKFGIKKYSLKGVGYGAELNNQYFWGDFVHKNIKYVRGNTFNEINVFNKDPYTPYFEKRFKYVNAWFSSSNGADVNEFIKLLNPTNLKNLEEQNGLCIVYTHFGTDGFLDENNELNSEVKSVLKMLSEKNGWFAPASVILDYIEQKRGITKINPFLQWLRSRK